MAIRRKVTGFTGNGSTAVYVADAAEAAAGVVNVAFTIAGTWSSVTAKLMLCVDTTTSPQSFVAVANASYTSDVADTWEIPVGSAFKVQITGAGSPLPNLRVSFSGYITPQ